MKAMTSLGAPWCLAWISPPRGMQPTVLIPCILFHSRFVRGGILGQLFGASWSGAGSNGYVDHPLPCADQYFQYCHFRFPQYRRHECHNCLDVGLHLLCLWGLRYALHNSFEMYNYYYIEGEIASLAFIDIIIRLPDPQIIIPGRLCHKVVLNCRWLRISFVAKEEKLPEKASPSQNEWRRGQSPSQKERGSPLTSWWLLFSGVSLHVPHLQLDLLANLFE